jgi:hypothetical protein
MNCVTAKQLFYFGIATIFPEFKWPVNFVEGMLACPKKIREKMLYS